MDITILCTDIAHPVNLMLNRWADRQRPFHTVSIVRSLNELIGGDILFLISCHDLTSEKHRNLYNASLVIHASDLPEGKGWSPHIWQILDGKKNIVVSLIEAQESIDSGDIWKKVVLPLEGHELSNEINDKLFQIESDLMNFAIENIAVIQPERQKDNKGISYSRRTPADSRIDPNKTIAEQFDILRVSDFERYPAFFSYRDCEYVIKIEKKNTTKSYKGDGRE